ncbi:MAG TPA: flagellar assembly protein FliW [Spirochaetia bacterium]|nr:flagellar assembly protein FliW [Spirochaetia bacterium]
MIARTKPYGEIEIADRQCLHFPGGLFGFEDLTEFALLDAQQAPFYWLQSLQRVEVAFVLLDPRFFRPDYTPDVDTQETAQIEIQSEDDLLVFAIVTIPDDASRMTANLQGPILVNRRLRVGRQSISLNPRWGVRHGVMEELARAQQGAAC